MISAFFFLFFFFTAHSLLYYKDDEKKSPRHLMVEPLSLDIEVTRCLDHTCRQIPMIDVSGHLNMVEVRVLILDLLTSCVLFFLQVPPFEWCVCVRACVRACVRVCVCVCGGGGGV